MTIPRFASQIAYLIVALSMLWGCDRAVTPVGPMPDSRVPVDARQSDLLYVADRAGNVNIYSYPKLILQKAIHRLYPAGMCVDAMGNVWVTSPLEQHAILEYAHGGLTPIASLEDPGNSPASCSVDPRTGSLAVVNSGTSTISIYPRSHGTPTIYSYHNVEFYFCGYDGAGNLYADGLAAHDRSRFLQLRFGGRAFANVALDRPPRWPGGIQWDGRYVVASDQGLHGRNSALHRFSIEGARGTTVGIARLRSSLEVPEFWLDGSNVIGADTGREGGNAVRIWRYPAGGQPHQTLNGFDSPSAVVISRGR
ncbi:MAG TPA: hypothetical protein VGF86_07495 [Candidatus Tumulicola sp.]